MNHAPYADARRDVESLAPASTVQFASTSTVHRLKRRQSPLERFVSSQFGVAFDKREGPWTNQGEALAMMGGLVLVFTSFTLPTANISLCGYTEYASNANVAVLRECDGERVVVDMEHRCKRAARKECGNEDVTVYCRCGAGDDDDRNVHVSTVQVVVAPIERARVGVVRLRRYGV